MEWVIHDGQEKKYTVKGRDDNQGISIPERAFAWQMGKRPRSNGFLVVLR